MIGEEGGEEGGGCGGGRWGLGLAGVGRGDPTHILGESGELLDEATVERRELGELSTDSGEALLAGLAGAGELLVRALEEIEEDDLAALEVAGDRFGVLGDRLVDRGEGDPRALARAARLVDGGAEARVEDPEDGLGFHF
ncbi:MAG TPA: hypothetical protein PKW35_04495 [Nannocystaceae bacterium]|nr:hypothetical protein [Nannocystaceae bacterium]